MQNPKFYTLELNIDFKIPRWHRSITTPSGEIFLTGGLSVEEKDKKLTNCYILSFEECVLKPITPMLTGRSGHALVYANDYLFAIGGCTENKDFT